MQTLKYEDDGLNSVAVDQAGNLVTDDAGNLVIPIEHFYIECGATAYGSDPDYEGTNCGTMTVTLPDRTVEYYLCPGEFKNDEIAVFKHYRSYKIIRFNARTLKELYGDSFSMTVDVFADYKEVLEEIIGDGGKLKCEDVYYNTGGITMLWGNDKISSHTDICGHGGRHTAKFAVNFTDMTISSDTESIDIPYNPEDKCDRHCYEHLEPYEVTIHCDKALCDDGRTVYMSTSYNRIFASQTVVVKVEPSENEEEEIAKAAICDVFSHETREWITAAELVGRYFRDKDKDQKGDSDVITAYKCQKDNDANDNLWVEKRHTDANVTGRVWSKVWEGAPAEGVGKPEYLATKNVVATDLEWEYRSEESDFTADIYLDDGYHPCTATYGGMASFICNNTLHMQPYFFLMPKDNCPQLESFVVYGMVYSGEEISVEEYFELYLDSIGINPRAECDGDGRFVEYVDYEFNIGGSVKRNGTGETGFYYDNKFYILVPSGDEGYVYGESEVNAYGWSKSPCNQTSESTDTIYTKTENPGIGEEHGIITNGVFQWQGTVSAFGNGLYSVTGSDGIVRYWEADIDVQKEETDEEFE